MSFLVFELCVNLQFCNYLLLQFNLGSLYKHLNEWFYF
jgi:hypothetical protein